MARNTRSSTVTDVLTLIPPIPVVVDFCSKTWAGTVEKIGAAASPAPQR
jgi:hypothetical protein